MSGAAFIAGDWGTSHLRLNLCDAQGCALAHKTGPGVAQIKGDFSTLFDTLTESWTQAHGVLPTVLCGMVGSSLGWANVPYLDCPARPAGIALAAMALAGGRIRIVPGLSCRNRNHAPDMLRGEETQVLGALRLQEQLNHGRQLLCLPGTHTKWVLLDDGVVQDFMTAVTGEVFALIKDHSVLIRDDAETKLMQEPAFKRASEHAQKHAQASLLNLLFECRSRQLAGELQRAEAASYLSGLLIGADVAGALRVFDSVLDPSAPIVLVGAAQLTANYATVLAMHGMQSKTIDGNPASLAGLAAVYAELEWKGS